MRRINRTLLMTLVLSLVALALAQDADPSKPSTWFLTAAGWGGIVIAIVAFIKANVLKNLHGFGTILVSFLVAVGGAFLASTGALSILGINLTGTTSEVFGFGLTAFIVASGGRDGTVGAIKAARK